MSNQIISSGSMPISGSVVATGDILKVNSGAAAYSIVVDGGQENLFGSGSATTIEQNGTLTLSGGSAFSTTVSAGGNMVVDGFVAVVSTSSSSALMEIAGSAVSTTVDNGGTFVVLDGNLATGLTINDGGTALIDAGAFASDITVASGGILVISATQSTTSVSRVVVANGGNAIVLPGPGHIGAIDGAVISTGVVLLEAGGGIVASASTMPDLMVNSGTIELVLSGGVDNSGTVTSGANQQIFAGGSASTVVLSGGFQTVNSGATASRTTVDQGAVEYVYSGGTAASTIVNTGGFALVDSGGFAADIMVNNGGIDMVDGEVSGTTVNSGGGEYVVFSGAATATTVNSGGFAYVLGTASGTQIDSGAYEAVESGGIAVGVTVNGGGILLGYTSAVTNSGTVSGAVISNATISSGGIELLFSGATDSGTTVESGGIFIPLPGATADPVSQTGATIVATGVVEVNGGAVTLYPPYPVSVAPNLTLSSGMSDYVLASGRESGTTIGDHGYSEVDAGGLAIDTIIRGGGTLVISSGGAASGRIAFDIPGGVLVIDTPTLPGAVISRFESNDTIDFGIFAGGSIAPTVSLLAGNTLQVTNGATTETVQLAGDYSSSTFNVTQTNSGAEVTVTQSTAASIGAPVVGGVVPVDIPLYVLPYQGGYKIGIQVSLNGGASYNMYEFDTGGTGFYAAYSPTSWSSYSAVNVAPVVMNYVSGNSYTAQIVSTNVTFQTTSGGTISIDNADIGLIAAAQNLPSMQPPNPDNFTTQQWNSHLTGTPPTQPLQTNFYGDFGMAMGSENGIEALLPQLPDGLSNGYIISVGPYPDGTFGQTGSIQVGLTKADIASFTTIISMQGKNTLDTYPVSHEPTYAEALGNGVLKLQIGQDQPSEFPTGFIFDTGTPTMRVYEGTIITPEALNPFLVDSNGSQFSSATEITTSASAATEDGAGWVLSFNAGNESGQTEALSSQPDPDRPGSVNTGLNAFFGYRIMFDLADGIMGFQALPCFAAGTQILTPRGEVDVAVLRPGGEVMTVTGAVQRTVWIGRRDVDCHRHPSPQAILPVRVQADAFGPLRPRRDLYLSPDHALFLEGVLIPVKHLLNGSTVAQVQRANITYYHVELSSHDVILVEGLPAETYLDTGNRAPSSMAAMSCRHTQNSGLLASRATCIGKQLGMHR